MTSSEQKRKQGKRKTVKKELGEKAGKEGEKRKRREKGKRKEE